MYYSSRPRRTPSGPGAVLLCAPTIVCNNACYPPDGSVERPPHLAAPLGVAGGCRPGRLDLHGGGGYGHGGALLGEGPCRGCAGEPLLFSDNELRVGHPVCLGSPRFSGLRRGRPCRDRTSHSTWIRDRARLGGLQLAPSDARTSVADLFPATGGRDPRWPRTTRWFPSRACYPFTCSLYYGRVCSRWVGCGRSLW